MWDDALKSTMDLLPVGVLTLDANGDLAQANRTGLSYLGLDAQAIGRAGFPRLFEDRTFRSALEAPPNGVVRLNVPSGSRTLHAEIRPHPEKPDRAKLVILRDVTGMEGLALLRRNFVFDLLHKLRTPLTTIMSVLSMATSGRLDPERVDFGEILGMGARQADRLRGLLSRLNDLFLLESGALAEDIESEDVPVEIVLGRIVSSLRSRFEEKGQTVEVDCPDDPPTVRADPEVLERALEMVVLNAHLFGPEGATIRIVVPEPDDCVTIRVEDDGPGISEEDLPFVFDRFRRGTAGHVRAVEGEGLGLYLARHMLVVMKGTITAAARPEGGTTVEITLRRAEEDE